MSDHVLTSDPRTGDTGCPDDEQLAAYLDGGLTPAERAGIERHAAACADCRTILAESAAFLRETAAQDTTGTRDTPAPTPSPSPLPAPVARRRWMGAAASLAAAAVVALALNLARPGSPGAGSESPAGSEIQELVAAVAGERTRPVEGRLTGRFAYAPPRAVVRSTTQTPTALDASAELSPRSRIAIAAIEERANRANTPQLRAALGVAYLIDGSVDQAIDVLARLAADTPTAAALSDLAAAYIARGQRDGSTDDFTRAADTAARALALDATLPEAAFNHALALELSARQDAAAEAWNVFRALDPASPWTAEIARRPGAPVP